MLNKDVCQAIKHAENSLRLFITSLLERYYGKDWLKQVFTSSEVENLERTRQADQEQLGMDLGRPLIYFSDFSDLEKLLDKHWQKIPEFERVLGKKEMVLAGIKTLRRLRNLDFHGREMFPHHAHLVLGIEGEIRTRIMRYRNAQEPTDSHWPRIEKVENSLGQILEPARTNSRVSRLTQVKLGDTIEFIITAKDPSGGELMYGLSYMGRFEIEWQESPKLSFTFEERHAGEDYIEIKIKGKQKTHRQPQYDCDFRVLFHYRVTPK